ncbi:hypothetical protein JQU17_16865 [Ponticoccus sp. SC2-23]|uniref:hypothetical protein n=1 Tax=Alexandriicola marinus TaxID=2081710 RepID=UPI000FD7334F|nr:hypothetical protein [Alexandriicola marinus]MBM1222233.1 hypothetical protein [Ponticoccus sp. SC6-9]MBM1226920.1 hypothetical protein [Ponticoccus sp. SC6-15]MBM1231180.1 hypothetical protein [Ponticoccus sp. SC6-38]MBM1235568.1 hypothetical protein [Ponticoccus sp. SC6-45]MBM1240202.1 hypothetical protein [Ponticoccus sp. SC6-49]MBM1244556.1 hypothetical protein [Ponticoccus sp. SC2-64]MBM1249042.1 hypothetical protein [Ponticoccus sp. SC6-42]MBM1253857.1 hypothetical protein [Pontico
MIRRLAAALILTALPAFAQEAEPPMTAERLIRIAIALDPEARVAGPGLEMTISDVPILIVMDPGANRMRAMVPIASADGLDADDLLRMMQANFDSALDARYAVANGRVWGVFLHPLAELERDQLISGLAQVVSVAQTYGTFYSSGAAQFGSGDSARMHRELLEDLLDRGEAL